MIPHRVDIADLFAVAVMVAVVGVTLLGRGDAAPVEVSRTVMWDAHLQSVNTAIARRDIGAAIRAWHELYVTALGDGRWEGLVHAADTHLRIGEVSGSRRAAEPKARALYLSAFFRARNQRVLEGVLRTAEAFAALGDREVAAQCLTTAEQLVAERPRDPDAARRFAAAQVWIAERLPRLEAGPDQVAGGQH